MARLQRSPAVAAATFDVDAIIPYAQVQALADDSRFWDARDAVNQRFKAEGRYITHLFPESEVFLRRDWAEHIVPITRTSRQSNARISLVRNPANPPMARQGRKPGVAAACAWPAPPGSKPRSRFHAAH